MSRHVEPWPRRPFLDPDFEPGHEASDLVDHGWRAALQAILDNEGLWGLDGKELHEAAIFHFGQMMKGADAVMASLIAEAKYSHGVSYSSAARALEVSRQAVHERYARQVQRILDDVPIDVIMLRVSEAQMQAFRDSQGDLGT